MKPCGKGVLIHACARCCFEMAMIVQDPSLRQQLKLDIVTVAEGRPCLVSEGLTRAEAEAEASCPGSGYKHKASRESLFPLNLLELAYSIDITRGQASVNVDAVRILNTVNKATGHTP